MIYSQRARVGSVPGISLQHNAAEEDELIERLRSMTIPEGTLQMNESFIDTDIIVEENDGTFTEHHTLTRKHDEDSQKIKATRGLCGKPSITSPDFEELEITAESVHNGIQNLRKDLDILRKTQLDYTKSFKADIQKKLLEFRKKAAKVDEVLQYRLDANNNEVFVNAHPVREQRHRITGDQIIYGKKLTLTEEQLQELEVHMELIRINVVQTKIVEYPSQLDDFRNDLSNIIKGVTDLKNKYYGIEGTLKRVMETELEIVQKEERFLKEEPQKVENLIKRCKILSTTLATLQKLSNVQNDDGGPRKQHKQQQQRSGHRI